MLQWLRICIPTQGDIGSIPGQGTEIPQASGQLSPQAATLALCPTTREPCGPQQRPSAVKHSNTIFKKFKKKFQGRGYVCKVIPIPFLHRPLVFW